MHLFLIFDTYTELDQAMPIIKYLSKKKKDKPYVFFFNKKVHKSIIQSRNISSLLKKNTIILNNKNIFSFVSFRITYLKNFLNFKSHKIKIRNYFLDVFIDNFKNIYTSEPLNFPESQLNRINKKSNLFFYPHAFTIKTSKYDKYRNINLEKFYSNLKSKYKKLELIKSKANFLVSSQQELEYHSKFLPNNLNLINVGNLKYKNISLNINKNHKNKKFRVLLILGKSFYVKRNSLFKFILSLSNFSKKNSINFDYKLHPRDINLSNEMTKFNNRYFGKVDGFLTDILNEYSLVIVNSKTSAIFDALKYKLPVLMFYIRSNKTENMQFEYIFSKKTTSLFSKYGLVKEFEHLDHLLRNILKIQKDKFLYDKTLIKQLNNFNLFINQDNNKSLSRKLQGI